jgi:hypothetical protein
MDIVLRNLVGTDCLCYINDNIVFSKTAKEHAEKLEKVLERIDKASLRLHPGKCAITQPEVNYLGYMLSEKGVSASEDKVKAAKNFPRPTARKDVRAFLGLALFYRRLVRKFAETAKPLTKFIKKNQEFVWGPDQQEAFDQLKTKRCSTPVLAYPNFDSPYILTTDASKVAVAAILSQVQNGIERPIAFASRQMNKAEQSYSASESEILGLIWATKYFRSYLHGAKFVARTDHAALRYLKNFRGW